MNIFYANLHIITFTSNSRWAIQKKNSIAGTNHLPICTVPFIGKQSRYESNFPYNLDVSLLQSHECIQEIFHVHNLVPFPQTLSGWILGWEVVQKTNIIS